MSARAEGDFKLTGRAGGSVWFDAPRCLAVAPGDPDTCYSTDLFRTYRTVDGGATWDNVYTYDAGNNEWRSRGLDVTTCYGVQYDPMNSRRIFIDYTDMGLFRSEDGGKTWIPSTTGVPQNWRNTTYWLALDPEVEGLMWGAFSGTHDVPRMKMWRGRDTVRASGGVAVSTDGGATWTPSNQGMPQTCATHIILDPRSPKGNRTLYTCGFGTGVWKSTDNGKTWTAKNEGLNYEYPFAWRIIRGDDGTLYLVVCRRTETGPRSYNNDGALYKSTDGAESWQQIPLPGDVYGPTGFALDPANPNRWYLSAWALTVGRDYVGGGVYATEDGGKTWTKTPLKDKCVYDVTVDPKSPGVVYACGFSSSAWRSTDHAETWNRIKGYNFKWGHRVMPDENDPSKVYILTFGGSVWHGPATGDPKAREDIVTPIPVN